MAKSQINRLKSLLQKEAKAKELLLAVQREREKMIAPTRAKMEAVFSRTLSEFLKDRLENLAELKINYVVLEKEIRALLEKMFPLPSQENTIELTQDLLEAGEEDIISAQICNEDGGRVMR